jgi:hypothetical protein
MAVPKTAMNENHGRILGQNDVGSPVKITPMKAETEASAMQAGAHDPLRTRMRASNARHVPASLYTCQPVGHVRRSRPSRTESGSRGAASV